MKFAWICFLVMCQILLLLDAQAANLNKKNKPKTCSSACPAEYSPVCAADIQDPNSKAKLFGNKCVLGVHNCEHGSNLVPVDENKCKNAGGIRLA